MSTAMVRDTVRVLGSWSLVPGPSLVLGPFLVDRPTDGPRTKYEGLRTPFSQPRPRSPGVEARLDEAQALRADHAEDDDHHQRRKHLRRPQQSTVVGDARTEAAAGF